MIQFSWSDQSLTITSFYGETCTFIHFSINFTHENLFSKTPLLLMAVKLTTFKKNTHDYLFVFHYFSPMKLEYLFSGYGLFDKIKMPPFVFGPLSMMSFVIIFYLLPSKSFLFHIKSLFSKNI